MDTNRNAVLLDQNTDFFLSLQSNVSSTDSPCPNFPQKTAMRAKCHCACMGYTTKIDPGIMKPGASVG